MDRLFQTALTGNVEELHRLLSENPQILHQVGLVCTENPLHLASGGGHVDYAKELLKLKPKFVEELSADGYTPLHIASANGHVELVKEMVKVNPSICRLVSRDGKTALHYAVLRGRVDVVRELLYCNGCLEDVTAQGETVLHLAVKDCQFESFRVLLDCVRQRNREQILNAKDGCGNTVLHLAVWKKQQQVLESLLVNKVEILEINATNNTGLTALDLLSIFPSEASDREIHEMLLRAKALKSRDLAQHGPAQRTTLVPNSVVPTYSADFIEHFKFHPGRDSPGDARSTLLVIAVLVTTATYQLGLSPPGNVWQDDNQGHITGRSILGTHNVIVYDLLIAFNSIGFCVSLYMIDKLTAKFPLQTELQICLLALYLTYNMAVPAISPPNAQVFTNAFTSSLPVVVPVSCRLLRKYRVVSRVVAFFRRCRQWTICNRFVEP